ncbi:hypothetical protein MGYG_02864 [Nannizzia gypsea CBS 118893]|uniref:Transcription factor domain-containing protein n=1 Tax=Arthroderma gypseum (strain ATCC MYA-4604 / CBS 118893) TaxID=535722 RepID=E4UPH7_ARTGP|nr:hypothetical protein MGYG_02864 [Nannizzia gypsea CBS 118893]EFQ99852.1 hypothetical protein MGYG_02864 [Nannizzia gypsea CBS 118893]
MGQSFHELIDGDHGLVFRVEPIRAIPQVRSQLAQSGRSSRCVLLPRYDEARVLLDKFIDNVSYIHHVVHHPSLPGVIDELYQQIAHQEPVKLGPLVLLLSIIASTTYVWGSHDDVPHGNFLFSSSAQANAQTSLWIKATYEILNGGENGPPVELETIQGIIIISILLCNLEGVSLRYRSLISTGLLIGREIGLHRTDHESNATIPNAISMEMGRRVWWYLAATDWLLAARYGGPGEGVYQTNSDHMMVKKPRNINDVDQVDGGANFDLPVTQLTDMSYFLQRIRLAEISRSIIDQHHDFRATAGFGLSSYHTYATAMGAQLEQMMEEIPSFLRLDSYKGNPDSTSSATFVQAYMLNSIIHTQRCKLHLSYLTSRLINDPTHVSWREKCLESARHIIHAEAQLEKTQHHFVIIRLRLSGILYGVFMAGIVLLMDACVNRPGLHLGDVCRSEEAAEALRIIDSARSQSLAAANLHNLLMQVLAKYRAQQLQQSELLPEPSPLQLSGMSAVASVTQVTGPMKSSIPGRNLEPPHPMANSTQIVTTGLDSGLIREEATITSPGRQATINGQPTWQSNQLAQSLGGLMDLDGLPWDDLLSGMDSTSFAF